MGRKPLAKGPDFHVVMDTNCLYTDAEAKLLSKEISEFISETNKRQDIAVKWYLPSIVKAERHFQMTNKAATLLESLPRLEKLLDKSLGIERKTVEDRIAEIIKQQVDQHEIIEIDLDADSVDWTNLIHRSAYRLPPFKRGDKTEKGFRDA